jgi:hypothetical protein
MFEGCGTGRSWPLNVFNHFCLTSKSTTPPKVSVGLLTTISPSRMSMALSCSGFPPPIPTKGPNLMSGTHFRSYVATATAALCQSQARLQSRYYVLRSLPTCSYSIPVQWAGWGGAGLAWLLTEASSVVNRPRYGCYSQVRIAIQLDRYQKDSEGFGGCLTGRHKADR